MEPVWEQAPAAPRLAPLAPPPLPYNEIRIDPDRLRELGLAGANDRRSRLAEEMRLLKRRLIQKMNPLASEAEGRTNLILVTSAVPGEGKSFISLNLALSFVADEHFDVLLIDADAMRPTILKMLGLPPARGLSDLLMHPEMDPSEVLLRDPALRADHPAAGGRGRVGDRSVRRPTHEGAGEPARPQPTEPDRDPGCAAGARRPPNRSCWPISSIRC